MSTSIKAFSFPPLIPALKTVGGGQGQKQARKFSLCLPVKSFSRKFQEGFLGGGVVSFCFDEWVLKVGEGIK